MKKFLLFFIILSQLYQPSVKAIDPFAMMILSTGLVSVGTDLFHEYKKYEQKIEDEKKLNTSWKEKSDVLKDKNFLSFYTKKLSQKEIGLLHLGLGLIVISIGKVAFFKQDYQGELINSNAEIAHLKQEVASSKLAPPPIPLRDREVEEFKELKKTDLENKERINQLEEQLKKKDAELELIERNQNKPPLPLRLEKELAFERQIAELQAERDALKAEINELKVQASAEDKESEEESEEEEEKLKPVAQNNSVNNRGPLPPIPAPKAAEKEDKEESEKEPAKKTELPKKPFLGHIAEGRSNLKPAKNLNKSETGQSLPKTDALPLSAMNKIVEVGGQAAGKGVHQSTQKTDNNDGGNSSSAFIDKPSGQLEAIGEPEKEKNIEKAQTSAQIFEELGVTEDTELTREFFNKNSLQLAHVYSDLTFAQKNSYTSFKKQQNAALMAQTKEEQNKECLGDALKNGLNVQRGPLESGVVSDSWFGE